MLRMTTNAGRAAALLSDTARKQLPFATALGLTRLAQASQSVVRPDLSRRFTIRNRFTAQEVRITPANKQTLQSEIGSSQRSGYMARQQDGGIRTPRGRHIAIPVNAKAGKIGIVRKANRPKALLNDKSQYFLGQAGKTYGIFKRRSNASLLLMYRLVRSAKIDPRYELDDTVTRTVGSRYGQVMTQALDFAMRTAK